MTRRTIRWWKAAALAAVILVPVAKLVADAGAADAGAAAPAAPVTPAAIAPAAVSSTPVSAPAAAPEAEGTHPAEGTPEKAELIGAASCLACHENKEGFHKNIHARAWPKAKGIAFEQSCETCHGPGSLHASAAGDRANPGFATVRHLAKLPAKEAAAVCMTCHEGKGRTHWEGSVHEGRGVSCMDCHSMHAGFDKNLKAAKVQDVCTKCHQNLKGEISKRSHHPILEGKVTCTSCHNPHGTAGPKLLVGNGVNQTCFQCHTDKRGPFLWEHRPVTEACTTCHTPHGSVHDKLLRQRAPYLCQSCHSNAQHPGTIYAENPATVGANTYQKFNSRVLYRACVNCHSNIHGSNHPTGKAFTR